MRAPRRRRAARERRGRPRESRLAPRARASPIGRKRWHLCALGAVINSIALRLERNIGHMEETAKERAARRWRESQAPTEVPKVEPASVAPLGCKEAGASGWFAASAFDTSARAVADAQYVFAGAFVAHHYLRDAMRRADRTAAAASVRARPLRSDDDDIDKACQPQRARTPALACTTARTFGPHRGTLAAHCSSLP